MPLPKLFLPFFLGLILLPYSGLLGKEETHQHQKLIFAVDVIRHGDRNPIIAVPKAPHVWPEGLGQLTPTGMRQEYELGKKLRHRYVTIEKLLPSSYSQETIYVRSSDINRTLMSAECFLMGLYPPGTGPLLTTSFLRNTGALPYRSQPIPIHTAPVDHDPLLLPHHDKEALKLLLSTLPEYQQKEKELRPHFSEWSQSTGVSITNPYYLELLGDALYIYQLKHLPLPPGLSARDAANIITTSRNIFKKSFVATDLSGAALFQEITHYLQEASQQKTPLKYVLYSAHDSTIMSLLNAMGIPISEIPPYASDLNIALFEQGSHNYSVEITLNDHPLSLPSSGKTSCSLIDFGKLAKREPQN